MCFPHAGGSASFFRDWADGFGPHVEVVAVQYPGREDRLVEPHLVEVDELVDPLVTALSAAADRPTTLFGHSMGAAIAYEVARRLEQRRPAADLRLAVSARPAPHRHRPGSVHLRDDEGILAELRRLGGTDAAVLDNPELRALTTGIVRNDYRLIENYRPGAGPRLRMPVLALAGDRDPDLPPEEVLGWAEVAAGGFRHRVFPGDHFYLVPRRAEVAAELARHLG
ncbi:thioesterase II family protein [Saccharothrix xinjiangensis]|uniref:Thioesterase II family protein n=1 Tax=Saccharothrix xinjiangensis TaxID=204798 RepID=A0ABV9Y3I4_9PSEU